MMSDQWGTVSNSYRQDLQSSSPLASLLNQKLQQFLYLNGIFRVRRLKALQEKAGTDRLACKMYIQKTYFGYRDICSNLFICRKINPTKRSSYDIRCGRRGDTYNRRKS